MVEFNFLCGLKFTLLGLIKPSAVCSNKADYLGFCVPKQTAAAI